MMIEAEAEAEVEAEATDGDEVDEEGAVEECVEGKGTRKRGCLRGGGHPGLVGGAFTTNTLRW
jgi:hypothetical protein